MINIKVTNNQGRIMKVDLRNTYLTIQVDRFTIRITTVLLTLKHGGDASSKLLYKYGCTAIKSSKIPGLKCDIMPHLHKTYQ